MFFRFQKVDIQFYSWSGVFVLIRSEHAPVSFVCAYSSFLSYSTYLLYFHPHSCSTNTVSAEVTFRKQKVAYMHTLIPMPMSLPFYMYRGTAENFYLSMVMLWKSHKTVFLLFLQDVLIKVGLSVHFQLSNHVTSHIGGHVGMCLFMSAPSQTPVHPMSTQAIKCMGKLQWLRTS